MRCVNRNVSMTKRAERKRSIKPNSKMAQWKRTYDEERKERKKERKERKTRKEAKKEARRRERNRKKEKRMKRWT